MRFDGSDYVPALDNPRLVPQHQMIFNLMRDGVWRTLTEIEEVTGYPPPSISAQLRHLRKERFGAHTVNKRLRKAPGLWEYQVKDN